MYTVVRLGARICRLRGRKPWPMSCVDDITPVFSALLTAGYLTTYAVTNGRISDACEKSMGNVQNTMQVSQHNLSG